MKKLFIVNQNNPVIDALTPLLDESDQVVTQMLNNNYQSAMDYEFGLEKADWLLAALGPNDVDQDFEALFAAIDDVQPQISHFIMLSYAGIDDELAGPMTYPAVADRTEFIKQQRYAIKLVDEAEIPYSIIRVSELKSGTPTDFKLYNEGEKMPNGQVTVSNVAEVVFEAFFNAMLINKSVGIVDTNQLE